MDPALAVKTDTWHFKYFKFIRGVWGLDVPARTSLCPYCQTMFWFSLGAIILSPLIILGWTMMKFIRVAYKSFAYLGMNWAVDLMDKMGLGECVDFYSKKSQKAPLPATIIFTLGAALIVALVGAGIAAVLYAVFFLIANIGGAPGFFSMVLTKVGWFLFMVATVIGAGLHYAWFGIHWFFTNGALWRSVGYWTAFVLIAGFISFATCYLVYLFSRTRPGEWLIDLIMLRVNGFGKARKEAIARREAEKAKKEAEEYAKPEVPYVPTRIDRMWAWVKSGLFNQKVRVGKGAGVALGMFGIAWEYAKGIHKNACPIIDFVNADGSKPTPPPPPPPEDEDEDYYEN